MVLNAIVFLHKTDEFEGENALRNWLGYDLKKYRRGGYHLREPAGLVELEEGSLVFLHKSQLSGSVLLQGNNDSTHFKLVLNCQVCKLLAHDLDMFLNDVCLDLLPGVWPLSP